MTPMQADVAQIISDGWRNGKTATEVAEAVLLEFGNQAATPSRPRPCPQEAHDHCVWPRCDCASAAQSPRMTVTAEQAEELKRELEKPSDLKIVVVHRDLFYHESAYVRGLEQALVEAHAVLVNIGGLWHGNEARIMLVERIETLLKKVDK